MTWLLDLYKTYEENEDQVGTIRSNPFGQEYMLLPEAHGYQTAHVEIALDSDGKFISAKVLEKGQGNTVIPCTINSSTRANAPSPHALHDNLQYVAGDYDAFGGKIKAGNHPFQDYLKNLKAWCESEDAHPKAKAIYNYVEKGQLIADLTEHGVLFSLDHKLIPKWNKDLEKEYDNKPEIFKALAGDQFSTFVRFNVLDPDLQKRTDKVWEDLSVFKSYIRYYEKQLTDQKLCYVTGEKLPSTEKHPSKIRYGGDMAKLISGNDNSGFTFRGRLSKKEDVATISYDVSQKAHNALKWLITKQGKVIDGRVFLTWGSRTSDDETVVVPSPGEDLFTEFGIVFSENEEETKKDLGDRTHQYFAKELKKALAGYRGNLTHQDNVYVMLLDAATPGRMSIVYYRKVEKELYLERIQNWHNTCWWRHSFRKNKDGERVSFYGAPATRDIAGAAYGPNASDKLTKNLMERMLPCIVDGKKIPLDIVNSVLNRTTNPAAVEKWEWEKHLSIACAIMHKHYEKEEFTVPLDKSQKDRNYLFGRLLAVADVLENRVLSQENAGRTTNAFRYMNAFSKHPLSTWRIIQESIAPYQVKLGAKGSYYRAIIDEIGNSFDFDDFNDRSLNGKFLLGYYSQRYELYQKKEDKAENIKVGE